MKLWHNTYATRADFCRVFVDEMDRLYLLAFLLLTNRELAEKCFVRVLHAVQHDQTVFKSFASSWVRRRIIKDALHTVFEESAAIEHHRDIWHAQSDTGICVDAVTQIDALERFVFVMTVLEGYSTKESSLLLGCNIQGVREAQCRSLATIGKYNNLGITNVGRLQASA